MPTIRIDPNDSAKWLLSRGATDLSDASIIAAVGKTDKPAMDAQFVRMFMSMRDSGFLTKEILLRNKTTH